MLESAPSGEWLWEIDVASTAIPNTVTVRVDVPSPDGTNQSEVHYTPRDDGMLGWFTDCGKPLSEDPLRVHPLTSGLTPSSRVVQATGVDAHRWQHKLRSLLRVRWEEHPFPQPIVYNPSRQMMHVKIALVLDMDRNSTLNDYPGILTSSSQY